MPRHGLGEALPHPGTDDLAAEVLLEAGVVGLQVEAHPHSCDQFQKLR
jgi:hypothetical protein